MFSAKEFLTNAVITSTAPCRVDICGTWDMPSLAVPMHSYQPSSVNIALDLRTKVELLPYADGRVKVSDVFSSEDAELANAPLDGYFKLVMAMLLHFGISGLHVRLIYESPARSGLGGSGVLAVATIGAFGRLCEHIHGTAELSFPQIVEIAHLCENSIGLTTGMQDQCAAAYGGVNMWLFDYSPLGDWRFERTPLLNPGLYPELEQRLVVAYTGKTHDSSDINRLQTASFASSRGRKHWLRILDIGREFAIALNSRDWLAASALLSEEHRIRISIAPARESPLAGELKAISAGFGVGFAVAGAGDGGCVFSLCPDVEIKSEIESEWENIGAGILPSKIARDGLTIGGDENA